jgi:hypothetical protein
MPFDVDLGIFTLRGFQEGRPSCVFKVHHCTQGRRKRRGGGGGGGYLSCPPKINNFKENWYVGIYTVLVYLYKNAPPGSLTVLMEVDETLKWPFRRI